MLVDSNLIIYAASGKYPDLLNWLLENKFSFSTISLIETLGYHQLKAEEKAALETIFSGMINLYPNSDVFQIAVDLRQQQSMTLGDAMIAATALYHDLALATHNTKDFDWIKGLNLIDPLKQ